MPFPVSQVALAHNAVGSIKGRCLGLREAYQEILYGISCLDANVNIISIMVSYWHGIPTPYTHCGLNCRCLSHWLLLVPPFADFEVRQKQPKRRGDVASTTVGAMT